MILENNFTIIKAIGIIYEIFFTYLYIVLHCAYVFSQNINSEYNQFITKYFQMNNKYNQGYIDYISNNEYIINFFNNAKNFIEDINPQFWKDVLNNPKLIEKYP